MIATRARQRVEVFSSMRPTDVLVEEKTGRGVRAFRNYLEYAKTGRVQSYGRSSEREPDSEFEEAVGTVVKNLGYEIVPQVGVEGFFNRYRNPTSGPTRGIPYGLGVRRKDLPLVTIGA